ncbi:MAG: hypothetical protein ACK4K7_12895 [Allosphingosinicella sp.]|uniref:hypothetical protein n=1 Tax=Allosphingosinicella sp. TaxID=2823234 RepID=UPI003929E342
MKHRFTAALFAASIITLPSTSVAAASEAQAQDTTSGRESTAARTVRAACCRCVDGSKLTASIATGTAPWRATTSPAGTALSPVVSAGHTAWAAVPGGSWVGPAGAPTGAGNYTYELVIEVPRCVIGGRMSIEGRFAADNRATLYFGNNQVAVSQGTQNHGFQAAAVTPFTITGVTPGTHVLRVVVYNLNSITGLAVSGQVTTACPASVELSQRPATDEQFASACGCSTDAV